MISNCVDTCTLRLLGPHFGVCLHTWISILFPFVPFPHFLAHIILQLYLSKTTCKWPQSVVKETVNPKGLQFACALGIGIDRKNSGRTHRV